MVPSTNPPVPVETGDVGLYGDVAVADAVVEFSRHGGVGAEQFVVRFGNPRSCGRPVATRTIASQASRLDRERDVAINGELS